MANNKCDLKQHRLHSNLKGQKKPSYAMKCLLAEHASKTSFKKQVIGIGVI